MKFLGVLALVAMLSFMVGCSRTAENANANANAANTTTTRTGPDNSEITSTTDANGVTTETRVFRNNPRIARVVVTTRNGQKTARAYSPSGEEKEINNVGDALEATGDTLAQAANFVADKAEDAPDAAKKGAEEVADKAEDVGDAAKKGVKEVGDKAEDVGDKAVSGTKTVGKKTVEGTKKVGSKVKDAITP